ncbi:hypothetical protein GOV13_04380 [Candidatus Pacearchaeota archaeon]|nr:hypothetical protein [Candidatus Pacearchaeota archaeon]
MKKIEQVEIENGKFILEGKIVEAEPLGLMVLNIDFYEVGKINQKLSDLNKDSLVVGDKTKDLIESKIKEFSERKEFLLREFYEAAPQEADAYVSGLPETREPTGGWGEMGTFGYDYFPILYLKLKRS